MKRAKSKDNLITYFAEIGAEKNANGSWRHKSWNDSFTEDMWLECGVEYENLKYHWIDKWLEDIEEEVEEAIEEAVEEEYTTKHYDFYYKLSDKEVENKEIKLDPYKINKVWGLNSKDDTGGLFHILKNISRFGDKNSKQRELKAIIDIATRMMEELNGNS